MLVIRVHALLPRLDALIKQQRLSLQISAGTRFQTSNPPRLNDQNAAIAEVESLMVQR
jgi:hypothetical protein